MIDLEQFLEHYIIAALWSSNDDDDTPLDTNYGAEDLAPETLDKMRQDCRLFISRNEIYLNWKHPQYTVEEQAGHDFWLTRNGHGAGFWDRDFIEKRARDILTESSKRFGEVYLYVGDDGMIYLY